MLNKYLFLVLIFAGFILVTGIVGGCGLIPKTGANYSYYYPDWTPDGKIICIKEVEAWTETTPWPYGAPTRSVNETKYYITTMSEEGTQETDVKQINAMGKVAASPLGNYIAYTEGNYIRIIDASGNNVNAIDGGVSGEISSFDWSPDESALIYENDIGSHEVHVVNRTGANDVLLNSDGGEVAWKQGNKIIYIASIDISDWGINVLDGTSFGKIYSNENIKGGEFTISKINIDEVVFRSSKICKFNLSSPEAEPITIIDRNDIWNIHLSPNGQKIIGTGSDSDLGSEIWIIDIGGTGLKQIK